ncbi:GNAT family N-acetyltransferase [Saccharopolyspora sp. NFXS83]|uniref:helix-turn-helix domain-containing GNAT family N-acetyltransferase n=1 Tax=Saccharopolyspora sp. NFXS83 TaxID=2993560 RepID=UPI00224ADA42|nr:GNAT family N-acetyltransferase [Saccharopolyspora sp. NFXS83]MCX2730905.1 GNAT family N-acetyltransferase [Saccharopolyspora sp. NFXS83]
MIDQVPVLPTAEAAACAARFACLGDPTRVLLLHTVASGGPSTVGELAGRLGIAQSTCSHHLRRLAEGGYVVLSKEGTATRVAVDTAGRADGRAVDLVLGLLPARPAAAEDPVEGVAVRALEPGDWAAVRRIYGEGIATGDATFEHEVPPREELAVKWPPEHRWVAELDGAVAGWAALTPASTRDCYAGVAETSIYVGTGARGRGVGTALLRHQTEAADEAGLWTLQCSLFPENLGSLALHRNAGFRIVGVRERIGRLHGRWRDTIVMERRRPDGRPPAST